MNGDDSKTGGERRKNIKRFGCGPEKSTFEQDNVQSL